MIHFAAVQMLVQLPNPVYIWAIIYMNLTGSYLMMSFCTEKIWVLMILFVYLKKK